MLKFKYDLAFISIHNLNIIDVWVKTDYDLIFFILEDIVNVLVFQVKLLFVLVEHVPINISEEEPLVSAKSKLIAMLNSLDNGVDMSILIGKLVCHDHFQLHYIDYLQIPIVLSNHNWLLV